MHLFDLFQMGRQFEGTSMVIVHAMLVAWYNYTIQYHRHIFYYAVKVSVDSMINVLDAFLLTFYKAI